MLQNYLKIALRSLLRQKSYSAINIIGLALGMACCLIMFLFVRNELSYDKVYTNAEQLYRLSPKYYRTDPQGTLGNANSPLPVQAAMMQDLKGIKYATRVFFGGKSLVKQGANLFTEEHTFFADNDYFQMFRYDGDFLVGDRASALREPFSMVITDEMARKYFGTETPLQNILGKSLRIDNADDYRITGIVKAPPQNVHLRFDALFSFATIESSLKKQGQDINSLWSYLPSSSTYIQLENGITAASVQSQFPAFVQKYLGKFQEEVNVKVLYELMPIREIHLNPNAGEFQPQSSMQTVSIFGGAALFILAIACMNFMNLATARSQHRAKEVGVRKVLGAGRKQLVLQFLAESVMISLFALALALVLVELVLPSFNAVIGKNLKVGYGAETWLVLGFVAIALLTGVVAGSYPAFILSGFAPIGMLKGRFTRTSSGAAVRKSLVVVQFAISLALIVGTIVVFRQLEFTRSKDLGLRTEQVLKFALPQDSLALVHSRSLMQSMASIPGVQSIGATDNLPGEDPQWSTLKPEGTKDSENKIAAFFTCEPGFLTTMSMMMKEGRTFSEASVYDREEAFILNEAAAEAFVGQGSPIGKRFVFSGRRKGVVIGVVKNFHFESLHSAVRPAILMMPQKANAANSMVLRVSGANLKEVIGQMEQIWKQQLPDWAFEAAFVDQTFAKLYTAEERLGGLLGTFAGLAIIIACLGLFGLAAYSAEIRTKEIGIRKVLGASVASIVVLLSKDFLILVGIAITLATPLTYWAAGKWLQDFAYKIDLSVWIFVVAGLSAVVIAILTMSVQAIRAAGENPVNALRSE